MAVTLRWGFIGTGVMAEDFGRDILAHSSATDTSVQHSITAIASSSDKVRAADLVQRLRARLPDRALAALNGTATYGSYTELVDDPNVDIVYVSTPHSHHFQNAMLALRRGKKHVLVEKSFTMTVEQAQGLIQAAQDEKRFLMEAIWTRFAPQCIPAVGEKLRCNTIGSIYRVVAHNGTNVQGGGAGGVDADHDSFCLPDSSSRLLLPCLAGGSLLDLGIYSLHWVFQLLYHDTPTPTEPRVSASISKYAATGVDDSATLLLSFPTATGVASSTFRTGLPRTGAHLSPDNVAAPSVRIEGSLGEIRVFGPPWKPTHFDVVAPKPEARERAQTKGAGGIATLGPDDYVIERTLCDYCSGGAKDAHLGGWVYQADECARCIHNGKLESDIVPLSETVALMRVMEEALRLGHVEYPAAITTADYSEQSPLNTGEREF